MSASSAEKEHRVLLLTPTRRDSEASQQIFARHGIASHMCRSLEELCHEAAQGAGTALVTQEAIFASREDCLSKLLRDQPSWSDLPLVVLTPSRIPTAAEVAALSAIGNMLLLQRPVQLATLVSTVQAALRDRARQYLVRDQLAEQAQLAAALVESDRRKDEFLAVLAHELRNPLAPLRAGIDLMLLDEPSAGGSSGEVLPMMSRQIAHMVRLIDDLLDLSRISQGKLVLRRTTVNLAEVIHNAVEATRPQIEGAPHKLTVTIRGSLPLVGDPIRLTQIFSNLLSNAAKYTDRGGRIELVAEREGDQAVIRVTDNGVGIPTEMLTRVFDMFAQVDSSLGRASGGLGIGLTLVKRIVELHGGTISAMSTGLGGGSRFTVSLPIAAEASERNGASVSPLEYSGPPLNVVIADDNADAAGTLGMFLKHLGHSVRIVHNGQQAVEAVCDVRPHLAIIDIGMPVLNGYEAAIRIRQVLGPQKSVYLAALTGWGQDEDRRKALEAGFDAHVVKPVMQSRLMTLLEAAAGDRAGTITE